MASKYIYNTEKFIQNLDDWLFQNEQKYAEYLFKNRTKVPDTFRSYSKSLYRGMTVDSGFIKTLYTSKMVFQNHTSWTKDKKIAEKFINDPKYKVFKGSGSGIKLLIELKIPKSKQILDIEGFVKFMGEDQLEMLGMDELSIDSAVNEKEVLIAKNIVIPKTSVKML